MGEEACHALAVHFIPKVINRVEGRALYGTLEFYHFSLVQTCLRGHRAHEETRMALIVSFKNNLITKIGLLSSEKCLT